MLCEIHDLHFFLPFHRGLEGLMCNFARIFPTTEATAEVLSPSGGHSSFLERIPGHEFKTHVLWAWNTQQRLIKTHLVWKNENTWTCIFITAQAVHLLGIEIAQWARNELLHKLLLQCVYNRSIGQLKLEFSLFLVLRVRWSSWDQSQCPKPEYSILLWWHCCVDNARACRCSARAQSCKRNSPFKLTQDPRVSVKKTVRLILLNLRLLLTFVSL